jgi:predicted nucleic-acid-binding Zn-ribbon protein
VELESYKAAENVFGESEAKDICCIMEGIHTHLLQLLEFKGSVYSETLKVQLEAALHDFCATYGLMQVRHNKFINFYCLYCSL